MDLPPLSRRHALYLMGALALPGTAEARLPQEFPLARHRRILLLGDSITAAGHWAQYLDAFLATRHPDKSIEVINLGLPSETISGLSEPDHPWPRPNVHERLERALSRLKPDLVIACYGMNDGIYHPFAPERFAKYQEAVGLLRDKVKAAGADLVLMTPPPFDPEPVRAKVLPRSAPQDGSGPRFSYIRPYSGYDEVLKRYGAWLLTLRREGVRVVDVHEAIEQHVANVRAKDPAYRLSGDGVHMGPTGGWLMAQALLTGLGVPALADELVLNAQRLKVVRGNAGPLMKEAAALRVEWKSRLPMPHDPEWDPRLAETERLDQRLSVYRLQVAGLRKSPVTLCEGQNRLEEYDAAPLAAGIDLNPLKEFSPNRRAAEVLALVKKRERILGPAWLTEVGHKRPDTAKGLPIAEAQRQAEPLTARIRELAAPQPVVVRIVFAAE